MLAAAATRAEAALQGTTVSTSCDTSFSVQREGQQSQASCHQSPCRDCLFLHAHRANFQAAIWGSCLEAKPNVPSPKEHGWTEEDSKPNIL